MRTLIVGLGNPILGDDGVGWRIAQSLQENVALPPDVEVICLALGGISLMEALVGYERVILVDSITTHRAPNGTVTLHKLAEFENPAYGHMSSAHDTSLQNALKIGRELGAQLPEEIMVVAIEAEKVYDFSEELTPTVAAAIPKSVEMIQKILSTGNPSNPHDTDHAYN